VTTPAARSDKTRALLLLLLLGAVRGPADRLAAQDLSSTVPDALSDRELQRAETRLGLSQEQVFAVERFYGTYQVAFAALARQEISPFRAEAGRYEAGGLPDPRDARRLHGRAARIRERIAALDEHLFDEVETVLHHDQLAIVGRLRWARERQRYRSGGSVLGGGGVVDLSEVIEELRLSGEQRSVIDSIMPQYEAGLTLQMRKIHRAGTAGFLEILEARAAAADGAPEQPLTETVAKIERRVRTLVVVARDRNRETCRRLSELLSPDSGQRVRTAYYSRAYLEIAVLGAVLGNEFEQARAFDELDAQQRETLTELEIASRLRVNGLVDRIADLVDHYDAAHSPFSFDPQAWENRERRIAQLQRETARAHRGAVETLAEALGPDLAARLDRAEADRFLDLWEADDEEVWFETDAGSHAAQADPGERPDPYLAAAITRRDIADYARRLDLAEEQRFILRCLHTDYRRQVRALEPQLIRPIVELEDRLWALADDGQQPSPVGVEAVNRLFQLRAAARDRLGAVEREFFEDVWLMLRGDQAASLARVRRSRDRQVHSRGPYPEYLPGSMHEVSVDLLQLLADQDLDRRALERVTEDLGRYETEITKAFRAEYEAAYLLQWALQEWEVVRRPLDRDTPGIEEIARPYIERVSDRYDTLTGVRRGIRELNEGTLSLIAEGLDDDAARSLREACQRATYAEIYADPDSAAEPLRAALELDDLTPGQHGLVSDLAAEHERVYARLCTEMIDTARADPGFPIGNRPDVWRNLDAREEALQRRLTERDELNERTRRRLALVLTDAQAARVGVVEPDGGGG
jgi:hypothetical protein